VQRAAPPPPASAAPTDSPQLAFVAPQAMPATASAPAAPASGVTGVVSNVLAWVALAPLATDSPTAPMESPALWAVCAWCRRQNEKSLIGDTPTNSSIPTQNGQTIDGVVAGDLTAAGDQGDRQALADTSISALPAPVTVDVASAATTSTTTFAQVSAASPQTQQSGRIRPGGDTTAPAASVSAPANGATVSGTVTVTATASDNVGVVGVQFLLNGQTLGDEVKTPDLYSGAYSVSWNTTTVTNGSYTLTAQAWDAAGNTTTSTLTPVSVTVDNADTTPPTAATPIKVGKYPVAVAVSGPTEDYPDAPNRAYVANYYDNTVSVIDTNTNTVITTISVGSSPRALTVSPDGTHVYVANSNANTVSVIDTNTNMVVETIAVPVERPWPGIGRFSYVSDVAVSPDGRYVYVTGTAGSGFTSTDGTVSVIDTTTYAVSGPYEAGTAATGIAVSPDGSWLYVATELWNSYIIVMDTATMDVIGTVFVTESYYPIDGAFTPDGTRLYMITGVQGEAAQTNGPAVMVIDTDPDPDTYNTVIAAFSDYDLFGGDFDAPSDVTFSPDGSRAYVIGYGGNRIAVIDTSTNAVVGHITTNLSQYDSSRHIAISADGETLYITDTGGNSLVVVSADSVTPTTL
jgi:YVTN family beta-propeller protein/YD repeat-containing protein